VPESFDIISSAGNYEVVVSKESNFKEIDKESSIILADQRITSLLPHFLHQSLISVPGVEASKSIENIAPIISKLMMYGTRRDSIIKAIGGGIIQDVATFVASIYMRGVKWDYYPTTLLGMVDSCIGGKSSINVGSYKNLVGNFYPPKKVIIDVSFLKTLSSEQIVSGLCEAVKICYASKGKVFEEYLELSPSYNLSQDHAVAIIVKSLKAKKWFIEIDEFDQNHRLLLNFGHTFGHALESATQFELPHGIAVGLGMLTAIHYSNSEQILNKRGKEKSARLNRYLIELISNVGDKLSLLKKIDNKKLMESFDGDKKHSNEHYRIIAPVSGGKLERLHISRNSSTRNRLSKIFIESISYFCF
jgi:3-dehydroquinate synthase